MPNLIKNKLILSQLTGSFTEAWTSFSEAWDKGALVRPGSFSQACDQAVLHRAPSTKQSRGGPLRGNRGKITNA